MLPFKEDFILKCNNNVIVKRYFDKDLESNMLNWHIDKEDRYVKVLSSNGWYFQFENNLPFKLIKNRIIFIKKGSWHRILNRNLGNLSLLILKKVDNENEKKQ